MSGTFVIALLSISDMFLQNWQNFEIVDLYRLLFLLCGGVRPLQNFRKWTQPFPVIFRYRSSHVCPLSVTFEYEFMNFPDNSFPGNFQHDCVKSPPSLLAAGSRLPLLHFTIIRVTSSELVRKM